jgi:hypothetical protein
MKEERSRPAISTLKVALDVGHKIPVRGSHAPIITRLGPDDTPAGNAKRVANMEFEKAALLRDAMLSVEKGEKVDFMKLAQKKSGKKQGQTTQMRGRRGRR